MGKDYYIGLDIGTDSVGWAVTDTNYALMRAKGKDLWGVRLFTAADVSVNRRTKRCARRRIEREKARKNELIKLFAAEIEKIDPTFFLRLKESKYHYDDRSLNNKQKYALFNDPDFTDKEYFKRYPTIFHLKNELLHSKSEHDIRLVFLAIYNYFSHRGHFLNTSLDDKEDRNDGIDILYRELTSAAEEVEIHLSGEINTDQIKRILAKNGVSRTKICEELQGLLGLSKKEKRETAILKLICGLITNISDLLKSGEMDEELLEEIKSVKLGFREGNVEEQLQKIRDLLPEEYFLLIELSKNVHDFGLLSNILGEYKYLSEARVRLYDKHKDDLKLLKSLIKDYDKTVPEKDRVYPSLFRKFNKDSYSAYVGWQNSYGKKIRRNTKTLSREDLHKNIKTILQKIEIQDERKDNILEKINSGEFLPKQLTSDNGVIPNQIHAKEIRKILANASNYLPFLNERDESNLTVAERILALFKFQIPYYIGPLGNHQSSDNSKNVWVKRKDFSKIYPWNIEEKIDMAGTAEAFIRRMVRKCTYLSEEYTLPKQSLLYEKFTVLNEINSICVDGNKISVEAKQKIYTEIFENGKKSGKTVIRDFLKSLGLATSTSMISGIDDSQNSKLSSYRRFNELFGEKIKEEKYRKAAEDIIFWGTIFGDDKKYLREKIKENYPEIIGEKELKRILGYKFKDWGKLSKTFLETMGCCKETGEIQSIIQALWNTNNNLMELLSDRFTYSDEIEEKSVKLEKPLCEWTFEDLDGMYLSSPVKRMIWQSMKIVNELQRVLGYPPKRIFVEMTRSDGEKGKRTDSRKAQLMRVYKNLRNEYSDLYAKLESRDDSELRIKKLYLYFVQLGKDMYTGETISLEDLFNDAKYDIDHIYPRSLVKDDSLTHNLVLVNSKMNRDKTNLPISKDIQKKCASFWKGLFEKKLISGEKYNRLMRRGDEFSIEEKAGFINRQLVETGQATKVVAQILGRSMGEDVEIIFNKSKLVSDFRHKFNIYKSRSVNDFHHANDAYLNIVVGNSYIIKFTKNPLNFLKKAEANQDYKKYHMENLFDYDIKNSKEIAWIGTKSDGIPTIHLVKKILEKNTPLVTRKTEVGRGEFYDETIYKAKDCKKHSYFPLKTKHDKRLCDVKKYGGKTSISTYAYALVEYTEGKKVLRTLESIPIIFGKSFTKGDLLEYLTNEIQNRSKKQITNVRLLMEHIPKFSMVKIDGYYYYLGGRTGNQLYLYNASQLKLAGVWNEYIKKIEKAIEQNWFEETDKDGNFIITAERNLELYEEFINRLKGEKSIFLKRKNSLGDTLVQGQSAFSRLQKSEQCKILKSVLRNISKIEKANLEDIKGSKHSGVCLININISDCSEFTLYSQSVTGLFSSEKDLLKL